MEELFKFTLQTRGRGACLTDRSSQCSERAVKAMD